MLYSHPQSTAGPIVNNTAPLTLRPTHCLPSQCRTHRSASTPVLNRDKDDEVELGAATLGCALCGGETKRELRERGVGKAGSRPLGRGRRHHSAGSDGGLGWDCRGFGEEMPTSLRRLGLGVEQTVDRFSYNPQICSFIDKIVQHNSLSTMHPSSGLCTGDIAASLAQSFSPRVQHSRRKSIIHSMLLTSVHPSIHTSRSVSLISSISSRWPSPSLLSSQLWRSHSRGCVRRAGISPCSRNASLLHTSRTPEDLPSSRDSSSQDLSSSNETLEAQVSDALQ